MPIELVEQDSPPEVCHRGRLYSLHRTGLALVSLAVEKSGSHRWCSEDHQASCWPLLLGLWHSSFPVMLLD